jgi:hypothetical protein
LNNGISPDIQKIEGAFSVYFSDTETMTLNLDWANLTNDRNVEIEYVKDDKHYKLAVNLELFKLLPEYEAFNTGILACIQFMEKAYQNLKVLKSGKEKASS